MRLSISIPDDMYRQILTSAAQQQLKTLRSVSVSDFIRCAIVEKMNVQTGTSEIKNNHIPDANAPVHNSIKGDGAQVKKRRNSKITPELHAQFLSMQESGSTARQIADALGCSVATIGVLRKKLKESLSS